MTIEERYAELCREDDPRDWRIVSDEWLKVENMFVIVWTLAIAGAAFYGWLTS